MVCPFSLWAAMTLTSVSIGSRPAFSASVLGITLRASAKASIANCSLPPTSFAYSSSLMLSSISLAPPPAIIFPSSSMSLTTLMASSRALSTSSTTCSVPPLMSIVTALGFLQPSTKIMFSPATFLSSTSSASPRSSGVRSLMLVTILAPVALASFSMSLFLTLLTANIPYLAR
ncbi:173aa long hypothetical protein [Pyrococcus horikoshii OT3]|uniref:Uncharacterized protein n=1 Tax=Pyrococcus horikoshii (strain ATCC 700860 / DSM 12428 / JCM 9974 / NBRC 100139 / OT-3) TaxID=70601 RepID=O57763_PYRHO|nr:173aa long hypothetical protein [Pyrococcus horikoshii OT3]